MMCKMTIPPEELAGLFSLEELHERLGKIKENLKEARAARIKHSWEPLSSTYEKRDQELYDRIVDLENDAKRYEQAIIIKSAPVREPKGYVYVAGPMRGIPHFNFPAFKRATERLRAEGYEVFSPAEADNEAYGKDVGEANPEGDETKAGEQGITIRDCMRRDCLFLCDKGTHIYMLRGWENSSGARAEHALANAMHLTIMYEGEDNATD